MHARPSGSGRINLNDTNMKTAILGTDLSAASDQIIGNSNEFKHLGIKKIILVYVLNLRSTNDFSEYNLDSAQEKLEDQKKRLMSFGFEADTRILMGIPAIEIMRQVKLLEAGLVIIGSNGSTWMKPTLGETASEVLHNMKCPVLLMAFNKDTNEKLLEEARQEELHHFEKFVRQFRKQEPKLELMHARINKHILLTTDFSDFSENAFQWLKKQAAAVPRLTIMHIQDSVRISRHLEDKLEEFNRIDTARLERLREEFRITHPESVISIVLEYGHPKQLIPKFIKDAGITLTVMGSQGRGYLSEFFLGSVSLRVSRQASSNLLIIPFHH
jgi:nucleotide-binding universal stress UspA family protein